MISAGKGLEWRAASVAFGEILAFPADEPGYSEWRILERTVHQRGVTVVFERTCIDAGKRGVVVPTSWTRAEGAPE